MLLTAAAVTGFSAYNKTDASDLLNANVEALARGEGPINPDCPNGCLIDPGKGCYCFGEYPDKLEATWN